jgi:hypothetical protein
MDDLEVRDLFAMLAMCGLLAKTGMYGEGVAQDAYEMADAMMKARKYVEPEAGIVSINKRKRTQ